MCIRDRVSTQSTWGKELFQEHNQYRSKMENKAKFGELALVIGDFHIPSRAIDIPEEFKELLVPNKVQNVLCTGNVGSRETLDWLKSLSSNFQIVKGDFDEVSFSLFYAPKENSEFLAPRPS
eukprot:TRINITY_DN71_c0_g1_i2.p5 TRINITY_DN71_c0_g1~~TRINITY_DN71_c0_g1_i2.p5  ORF type:complete len:122 (-),score=36.89 TRINITY_DN71_c0_g1_i2:612-977(-)